MIAAIRASTFREGSGAPREYVIGRYRNIAKWGILADFYFL
jgi:hypothetical protein